MSFKTTVLINILMTKKYYRVKAKDHFVKLVTAIQACLFC